MNDVDEVVRLLKMQSDTMKKAIINVMKATVGEYEPEEECKSRSVARRVEIQKKGKGE